MPPFFLFTFRSCALCPCSFPICHSLIFALGVITLTLTCFVPSSFWSFCARRWVVRPLFSVSLAPAPLPPLFVSVLSLGCLFSPPSPWPLLALRFPRVLCLVFLAVDWSRISSTALTPPSLWFAALFSYCPPSLSLLPCLTSVPVWYFWPQTGQGYHTAGPPTPFPPGTVSGRRLVQGLLPSNTDSWNFLLDSKLSKLGSNLTQSTIR